MSDKVTLRQILDLIDNTRESEEIIALMDNNGQIQCKAMVCSGDGQRHAGSITDSLIMR